MNNLANNETIETMVSPYPACAAEVVSVDGASVVVRPTGDWSGRPSVARPALPDGATVRRGDEVLVLGMGSSEAFIIAQLATNRPGTLQLTDGTCVEKSATGDALTVRNASGQTLFQYDVDEGGMLTLRGETIRLQSQIGGIELESATDVQISGRTVRMAAQDLQLSGERIAVSGRELEAHLRRARVRLKRAEIVADVIVETARDVYRRVRGLAQLRAGRVKTIADGTVWLKAKQVLHRSSGAYKIKGDDIQLG